MIKFAESRYSIAFTISDISPMRPIGWSEAKNGWISGECMGVLIIPAETAFTRTPAFGMFYREGSRRGVQRTLGERREHARHAAHWLVNQAGRDSYDMTTPRLAHHLYRALGI